MHKKLFLTSVMILVLCIAGLAPSGHPPKHQAPKTASLSGYERSSRYLKMRDGVRLAVDIHRPRRGGQAEASPLPAVWIHTPYFRGLQGPAGRIRSLADSPVGKAFSENGYALVIADVRGTGASFGLQEGIFTRDEARDAYEITEWIARQPWCNGRVGMMGGSYDGVSQLMAAAEAPPHLRAIFPAMALFDLYSFIYHGGVLYDSCLRQGDAEQRQRITEMGGLVAPVDEDKDLRLLKQATASRELQRGRSGLFNMFAPLPYRDSVDEYTGGRPYREWNPGARIGDIRRSGVAVYVFGGWFDLFTRDAFLLYANLDAPKKLFVVDTAHKGRTSPDLLALYISEQIRWFDRWLKDIDNGVTDEPPVALQRVNGPLREITRLSSWPPPGIGPKMFYFHQGPSRSVRSTNDGALELDPPREDEPADSYMVDHTATSGPTSRWANAVKRDFGYPDMTVNDAKVLTYTTSPLKEPLTLLGHPVISLWIKTAAADVDLFVYLEDVDIGGASHYVTEGSIRASHRKTGKPPYDNLGLPYQSHLRRDVEPVPGDRVIEVEFDLLPTYYRFDPGHRIRVAVAGADADNAIRPSSLPPLCIDLYHTPAHPSGVSLPVKDDGAGFQVQWTSHERWPRRISQQGVW